VARHETGYDRHRNIQDDGERDVAEEE